MIPLPLSAVVGQEEAKLALLLNAVDPRIAGVLLRGEKGTAKSTLARGLAALLPGDAPFVELPVGATEDRVIGTLDLAAALTGGEKRFEAGLLASADGGVLYVDEINLLPDHLVDVLLDVAASGVNRVEREGVSHSHPSRFLLVGSMNPEEGDLRPQLLDRFGLAVDVRSSADVGERVRAIRRRLAFDAAPVEVAASFSEVEAELAARLAAAVPATLPDDLIDAVARLCVSVGAEGLRADLTICRAAAALAGWEGREVATTEDVRRVAPLALAHRARRDPLDPAGADRDHLESSMDEHLGGESGSASDEPASEPPDTPPAPGLVNFTSRLASRPATPATGRGARAEATRGRVIGHRVPDGPVGSVAVGATVRAAAVRRSSASLPEDAPPVVAADLREPVRLDRTANLVVVAVDASGSMGAPQRVEAAKAAVLGLLVDAYQRRDLVSLVVFRGDAAEVLLRPTSSVEVARARLQSIASGGRTPLGAGLTLAMDVASTRASTHRPLVVVITDGRATSGPDGVDPLDHAGAAADSIRRAGIESVVVDVEGNGAAPTLGLARDLAGRMGARHVPAGEVSAAVVRDAVRSRLAGGS